MKRLLKEKNTAPNAFLIGKYCFQWNYLNKELAFHNKCQIFRKALVHSYSKYEREKKKRVMSTLFRRQLCLVSSIYFNKCLSLTLQKKTIISVSRLLHLLLKNMKQMQPFLQGSEKKALGTMLNRPGSHDTVNPIMVYLVHGNTEAPGDKLWSFWFPLPTEGRA